MQYMDSGGEPRNMFNIHLGTCGVSLEGGREGGREREREKE